MNNTIAEHNGDLMKKWGGMPWTRVEWFQKEITVDVLPKNGVFSLKIWPDVLQQLELYPRKEEPELMAFPFCYNAPLVSP